MKKSFQSFSIIIVIIVCVSACQKNSSTESNEAKQSTYDFNNNVGWLHNNCLAIKNSNLKSGDEITVVLLGKKQSVLSTSIVSEATSSTKCPQLLGDRKSINVAERNAFYLIKPPTKQVDLGIALVGEIKGIKSVNDLVMADINNDGKPNYFTECSSSEGLHFSVWSEKPWKGKKLWSSYYYLAYDIEPNCPQ